MLLLQKLCAIFPEKCAYSGIERLRALMQSATQAAERYEFRGAAATVLLTILMFVLGHEADRDPIHSWVEAMLRGTAYMEPAQRIDSLESKLWEELRNGMG